MTCCCFRLQMIDYSFYGVARIPLPGEIVHRPTFQELEQQKREKVDIMPRKPFFNVTSSYEFAT